MSCHSHLLGLRMYPPVHVINKESALSFIHLKVGVEAVKTLGSLNPGGRPRGWTSPVTVYTGRRSSARRRKAASW